MRLRIPLFPLNVVLFPGMPLSLHIFEPRYRLMVQRCLEGDRTFGVCLIRSGEEVGGPADPCPVGTLCEILTYTPHDDGRMDLQTVGRERFQVLRVFDDEPYLEAEVEILPEEEKDAPAPLSERVRDTATLYFNALLAQQGYQNPDLELPRDPLHLSYVVGAFAPFPLPKRQELLEAGATRERLQRELELLERATVELIEPANRRRNVAYPYRPDMSKFCPN